MISSDNSLAPDSTMLIACLVPATVNSRRERSACSCVGLMIISPSTYPTCTPAIGPSNGISEIDKAKDEPNMAAIGADAFSS